MPQGAGIALALKGFSCWPCFEALSPWLDGCCASGLWEARLAGAGSGSMC